MTTAQIHPLPADEMGVQYEVVTRDGTLLPGRHSHEGAAKIAALDNIAPHCPFPSADEYVAAFEAEVARLMA
jgi:hypothetical protein